MDENSHKKIFNLLNEWKKRQLNKLPKAWIGIECPNCKIEVKFQAECSNCGKHIPRSPKWKLPLAIFIYISLICILIAGSYQIISGFVNSKPDAVNFHIFLIAVFFLGSKFTIKPFWKLLSDIKNPSDRLVYLNLMDKYVFLKEKNKDNQLSSKNRWNKALQYCGLALTADYIPIGSDFHTYSVAQRWENILKENSCDKNIINLIKKLLFIDILMDLWYNTNLNPSERNKLFRFLPELATDSHELIEAMKIIKNNSDRFNFNEAFLNDIAKICKESAPKIENILMTQNNKND